MPKTAKIEFNNKTLDFKLYKKQPDGRGGHYDITDDNISLADKLETLTTLVIGDPMDAPNDILLEVKLVFHNGRKDKWGSVAPTKLSKRQKELDYKIVSKEDHPDYLLYKICINGVLKLEFKPNKRFDEDYLFWEDRVISLRLNFRTHPYKDYGPEFGSLFCYIEDIEKEDYFTTNYSNLRKRHLG